MTILTTACGATVSENHPTSPRSDAPSQSGSNGSAVSRRPKASDDSIALLENGHSLRDLELTNLYVPTGGRFGAVVEIHPTAQLLMLQVSKLPAGGDLLVCPVDTGGPGSHIWSRTSQACTPVTSTSRTPVQLFQADGNAHVAMEFDGNWKSPVSIGAVGVSYEAVDDYFYVDFAVPVGAQVCRMASVAIGGQVVRGVTHSSLRFIEREIFMS